MAASANLFPALGSAISTALVLTEITTNGAARGATNAVTYDPAGNMILMPEGASFGLSTGTWSAAVACVFFDAASGGNGILSFAIPSLSIVSGQTASLSSGTIAVSYPIAVNVPIPAGSVLGTLQGVTINGVSLQGTVVKNPTTLVWNGSTLVASPGVASGLVAHAGGTRALALPVTATINQFSTVATLNDSIALPAAVPGAYPYGITIINDGAAAATIYGQVSGTDTIDGAAAATGVQLTNATRATFYCAAPGAWFSLKGTKSS